MRHALRQIYWAEWDGYDYEPRGESIVYFTYGYVDTSRPGHVRELAKVLQRDGVVDTVPEGMRLIRDGRSVLGLVTYVGMDHILTAYSPNAVYEDFVDPEPGTWVEINLGDN